MGMYDDPIEVRLKRTKDALASRDYEGVTTVPTSDLIEIMEYVKLLTVDKVAKTVTIPKEEYINLLYSKEKVLRLEGSGVDNWNGYEEALYCEDDVPLNEFYKQLQERFKND